LLSKAKCSQSFTVSTESVGFNNFGPRFDEFLVHIPHDCGQRQVQFVVTPIEKYPFAIERGAHGSIGDQDAAFDRLSEFGGSGLSSSDCHVSFNNTAPWRTIHRAAAGLKPAGSSSPLREQTHPPTPAPLDQLRHALSTAQKAF